MRTKIMITIFILSMFILTACSGNNLTGGATLSDAIAEQNNMDENTGHECPYGKTEGTCTGECGKFQDENKDGYCDNN
ncbi:hypothetical protein K9L67_00015 [Candidatus Woesearchaeota archaeon]|nr:hypothetical protein [Candidatus Woesearchaeota archaeon]MCF7900591.1 hypothetical protein [Candidatus Woesearchaeota archaeon]MCF8013407.1 hypothetical protein [Candidatus Woesearchaeota archaeon]